MHRISLLLETMEKTLGDFVKRACLGVRPLHKYRFSYRTAILELTGIIEGASEAKRAALVAFNDI